MYLGSQPKKKLGNSDLDYPTVIDNIYVTIKPGMQLLLIFNVILLLLVTLISLVNTTKLILLYYILNIYKIKNIVVVCHFYQKYGEKC